MYDNINLTPLKYNVHIIIYNLALDIMVFKHCYTPTAIMLTKCVTHMNTQSPGGICYASLEVGWYSRYQPTSNGHLKISWTSTAELEIDKISRDDLIRVHV